MARFGEADLIHDFYSVFSICMRDLGTPVYGKSLFNETMDESMIGSLICLVELNGTSVSAAFLTGYRDVLEIPWASTLRSVNKYNVNMFMYRKILEKAIGLGYQFFDFGRSTKDANTFKFRKQWGAKPVDHFWYSC